MNFNLFLPKFIDLKIKFRVLLGWKVVIYCVSYDLVGYCLFVCIQTYFKNYY